MGHEAKERICLTVDQVRCHAHKILDTLVKEKLSNGEIELITAAASSLAIQFTMSQFIEGEQNATI